jgi:hypothetical protein
MVIASRKSHDCLVISVRKQLMSDSFQALTFELLFQSFEASDKRIVLPVGKMNHCVKSEIEMAMKQGIARAEYVPYVEE